jgi:hypothetical protein
VTHRPVFPRGQEERKLDLKCVVLARVPGTTLSLPDFFRALQGNRRLHAHCREALAEQRVLDAARQAGPAVTDDELQQAANRFRYRHGLTSAGQTRE